MKNKFDFQPKLFTALRNYSKERFMTDLMAGIIVGIVALPLAIAFGIASGVSPEKGLITAIIGGFIVSLLGGCNVQIGGPTGAFIVIVYGIIQNFGIEGLAIATVIAGIILVLMGVLKLGTVIKFIPYPIVVGFTSGIAVTIFTTQMKDLFGLTMDKVPADFISKWIAYFGAFDTVNPWAFVIGIISILVITLSPRLTRKIPGSLIAIIIMTIVVYIMRNHLGITGIETIGDRFTINASLPAPTPITFNMETINLLLPSAFTIAILGAIESLLSATVADGVTGDKHNSNTELIAQGAANIIVPIFGGIPVTGAIARTMTNINNGGRTPVAGIIHAIVLLLILLFLGPLTKHIPMACLAGVLIIVSYNMSEWRTFRSLMKNPKSDVSVLLVTFFLTVIFDLTIAIEIGLLIAMLFFMRRVAETTHVSVTTDEIDLSDEGEIHHDEEVLSLPKGVEVYEIDGPFFFGVANKFDGIMKSMGDKPKVRIIRMRKVSFIDSTGLHNLESLFRLSEAEHIHMILSGVNEHVHHVLTKSGFDKKIGAENICSNINEAVAKAKAAVQD
ncbi:SulP family inorganic anion transporter [Parabacteroides distasonis]|uniref:SulP family inorganic anion transporter n=2 Tax=Parabacteroides distasonis TaxID=823 RepID=UPI00189DADAC|nr:sulfate permease [Parabacteroides distasonis]MDB9150063.1 sulfate permease [Parabacteroides distasonis]MDB9154570.1 sulfate permease [Parabacteroides distasonis]MDB9163575.1 sulfate permease [Parabacteroides distasonis]MDB9168278.1 sulfate permease [Parabacteroides distasonis]MDB9193714.1 sulfate permease [Parabacteroides distasonis]